MTVLSKPSHAMFFNGISDGIVVPTAQFSDIGKPLPTGEKSFGMLHTLDSSGIQIAETNPLTSLGAFSLEAWVIPDCGGTIFEVEGVMKLKLGNVSGPGPASFTVNLRSAENDSEQHFTLTSATEITDHLDSVVGYEGPVYPRHGIDAHGAYSPFNTSLDDVTAFNLGHRELMQVSVIFDGRTLGLHINGDLVTSMRLDELYVLQNTTGRVFLGGRGGEFRGVIEAIHWQLGAAQTSKAFHPPIKSDATLALWRFEEPVDPISTVFTLPTVSASNSASVINIGATDAQSIINLITGKTTETSVDLTASPYSYGSYSTARYQSGGNTTVKIPQVPYNLLINPVGYSRATGKPNNLPPERVRLTAVDSGAGTITVESIHLDYVATVASGRRGLLHARAVTSDYVLVSGDCLVDGGTGAPYQPEGTATQFKHRAGQVVVDEGELGNHGIVFNMQMSTDTSDKFNKFSTAFTLGNSFQIGHTARHTLNHVAGHPFMGITPQPLKETITQTVDGVADDFAVSFAGQHIDIKSHIPTNSEISIYDSHSHTEVESIISESVSFQAVENGLAGYSDAKRALIAIGGAGTKTFTDKTAFDPVPFLLKKMGDEIPNITDDIYTQHLTPESESRVAILEVPTLSGEGYAPFVKVFYNAIDLTGDTIKYAASSRLTTGIGGTGTILTLRSTKGFGYDTEVMLAENISIGGTYAFTSPSTATATISHGASTITFSTAADAAFQTAAITNAAVNLDLDGAVLLVEKTEPSVSTVLPSGKQIIDLIHDQSHKPAPISKLHSPGGVIRLRPKGGSNFTSGDLGSDDTGGLEVEPELDLSLTPPNWTPNASTDTAQGNPLAVGAAYVSSTTHQSYYHKMTVSQSTQKYNKVAIEDGGLIKFDNAINRPRFSGIRIDNVSGYASSTTTTMNTYGPSASKQFAVGTTVYNSDGASVGVISASDNNTIRIGSGTLVALAHDEMLAVAPYSQSLAPTAQSSNVNEMFDIIDNIQEGGLTIITVHPSDKRRHSQLSKMFTIDRNDGNAPNAVAVQFLMGRGRVLSFNANDTGDTVEMIGHGLMHDIAGTSVDILGEGAPDSHIIKEIMPGAPVVTVTLGGPGQGAINTKATWDPSPIARLGWSTRRDCVSRVESFSSGGLTITVTPLNNKSDALASWGTYCFPKVGRVYVEMSKDQSTDQIQFASAEYASKTGDVFTFAAGSAMGTGKFKLVDGSEVDTFALWLTAVALAEDSLLHVDDKFNEDSICNDGTTVNDRLFQTLDTVQHDYQLGTQYASTRAMVEIPLFEEAFFENAESGIFPGPDNSMKLHLDATYTAHTWAPNPVGRRGDDLAPEDPEVTSAFSYTQLQDKHRRGTVVVRPYDTSNRRIYLQETDIFPIPSVTPLTVGGVNDAIRHRRAYLPSGEWVLYESKTATYLQVVGAGSVDGDDFSFSKDFLRQLTTGSSLMPALGYHDTNHLSIADNPLIKSAGYEGRGPYYYDRANLMTQGGNVDYGLRQYVSAVEFRAGPLINPHLERIQSGRARSRVQLWTSGTSTLILEDGSLFPVSAAGHAPHKYRLAYYDEVNEVYRTAHYVTRAKNTIVVTAGTGWNPSVGTEIICKDLHDSTTAAYPLVKEDAILNLAWANPYCPGGLRDGDTVWMNMHYTNPHAVEGLFAKSRGVLNEGIVSSNFNGGEGAFTAGPRDSIPYENFLIGNTCLETARNFVQHVNKTVELNHIALGLAVSDAPTVAYLDPYQCTEEHARILLYDVAHDREFIAMQDIWMQVQTSPQEVKIGIEPVSSAGTVDNRVTGSGTGLDVAAGFRSHNKNLTPTTQSDFIEGAMSHNATWNMNVPTAPHEHIPAVEGCMTSGSPPRTNEATVCPSSAETRRTDFIDSTLREPSTFFDTPDGTRVIPAFLAMKGIRSGSLDLTGHSEARLNNLDHWTQMEFARRLTVDLGEIGVKEGVTDIEAAAIEVVRLINQGGAKNGRTHARRPSDQYLGESERLDLSSIGVSADSTNRNKDPTAAHLHADFSATGSTHDPAPFWDETQAFASHDRGTHMGYIRAHLGRVVLDSNGRKGYSVIIHSTVPGASGRNFCAWLDNAKSQTPYKPQYLIGHGGRFRNYWCQPDEVLGENMHPAPMPINRHGRPFAPITTLKEFLPPDETDEPLRNNLEFGPEFHGTGSVAATSTKEIASGRNANTVLDESFETKSPTSTLVNGLRTGSPAKARINFGGLTQAGIPGWAPDAGKWGFGRDGQDTRFNHIYGKNDISSTLMHGTVNASATGGYIPDAEIRPDNIGDGQLYGIRMVDHRGDSHTVRMAYREFGQPLANDKTVLPPTLDDEIVIHFDDRDVGQGGFTIGKHMVGEGDVCGEYTAGTLKPYKGNLWNTYPSPAVGVSMIIGKTGATTLNLELPAPYHNGGTFEHTDILGYLGFPESGMIQINDISGTGVNGQTFYYTSRTHHGKAGAAVSGVNYQHSLYGVTGQATLFNVTGTGAADEVIVSPRINWTSLLTDEVIAAAMEYSILMDDPNRDDIGATSFDCTSMLAPDGRTLGEWGVSPTAIRVKAHSKKHRVLPLKHLFNVDRTPDWGLQAGASSDAVVVSAHTGGLTNAEKDNGARLDVGYLPETILHITTRYLGTNANTATPILVDSMNNVVDITKWQRNLRGENKIKRAGDLIIPCVENPMIVLDRSTIAASPYTVDSTGELFLICTPACTDTNSWGDKFTLWLNDEDWAEVRSQPGATSNTKLIFTAAETSANFTTKMAAIVSLSVDPVLARYSKVDIAFSVDGIRRAGSKLSSPFLYFRGGRDSPDHWVPLYFGGGFSGVTMDINDGTRNDYSDFYTHPYSGGPTGSAGLQNIGEVAGSYALVDTNAMFAMFPGTPHLDQHKGQNNPPFFNQDAMLSFDLDAGASGSAGNTGVTYAGGGFTVRCERPSPIVLRFAHQHARYSAGGDNTDHTTYMVFGPGQSIPHNFMAAEPQLSNIITTGNGYSAVPIARTAGGDTFLPNQIAHGGATRSGFSAYLPPSAEYQIGNVRGHNYVYNWEPAQGHPNSVSQASAYWYNQSSAAEGETFGLYYNTHFTAVGGQPAPRYAHPFDNVFTNLAGAAMGHSSLPTTRDGTVVWHMDGGYHPGGHFLDNHITRNPTHPVSGAKLSTGTTNQHNASSFRVSAQLGQAYVSTGAITGDENIIVIDATRCQNAEEMAAVLASSINTWPGKDPLKAIGGTFLPSFQSGANQDRYGWVKSTMHGSGYTAQGGSAATLQLIGAIPTTLPQYGWLRLSNGTNAAFAPYVSYTGATFTLGLNAISGNTNLVDPITRTAPTWTVNDTAVEVYIWTKSGTKRFNNVIGETSRDEMTQVHFNGLMNAVDRTCPIGAVGWHGEAYSYLNSMPLTNPGSAAIVHSAGTGAWHPFLGFNPYGATETCVANGPPIGLTDTTSEMSDLYCTTGLSSRHLIAITHESELPLIAKADRDGILSTGDNLMLKQTGTRANAGTVKWDTGKVHNKSRYVAPANGGPNVEAMMVDSMPTLPPTGVYPAIGTETYWHSRVTSASQISNATPCQSATGDLFWDESVVPSSRFHEDFSNPATAIVTAMDGDAASGMTEKESMVITSTDGTTKTYVITDSIGSGVATGTVLVSGSDTGAGTAGSAYAGGIAVQLALSGGSASTQNAFLVQLKAAIEHANGHNGKILVSAVPTQANGLQSITLTQNISGGAGNTLVTDDIGQTILSGFSGGGYGIKCTGVEVRTSADTIASGLYSFYNSKSAARNFNIEHVVWKRMDGGNLTMPASNARGLGGIPWTKRLSGGSYVKVGENILGNCRFSFETTNSAMFPIIQAQELSHPQIAEQHPFEIRNALSIPNEHIQFERVPVIDDTGQAHTLEGGSPFGTVIMDFRHVSDRELEGLAPSIAGSGLSPNMKIRLPDADEIPGNIIIRPGFDRIQSYQTESMGSGGLMHPAQGSIGLENTFTNTSPGPRLWPTWENNAWEHISQEGSPSSESVSNTKLGFPDITMNGWKEHTNSTPLKTSYEPHDRALYFHVTRMGTSMTHRYDTDELNFTSQSGTTLTVGTAPNAGIWKDTSEMSGGRWFLRVYDPTTNEGVLASYTNTAGSQFTGVVLDPDFTTFITGKTGLKVVPSYYIPGGSNRFFTARRLRDHSEYSGSSPDMANIDWANVGATPYTQLSAPKMTPMPIPRMGHHYVTPTMALLPGHYAHPAYQRLYDLHHACRSAANKPIDEKGYSTATDILNEVPGRDPLIWFSGPTAAYGPSDIAGGAFTLLTETKVKHEGYGIAASVGAGGTTNSTGGHSLVLEAAGAYTLDTHFPDPMEVGAYQVIMQPNTFNQQLKGFHKNNADGTKAPVEGGSFITELTGQQVNTVIAIEHDTAGANGGFTLVMADAIMADIRGCEVIINEMMLDFEPDTGSQFTNIPTLGLHNPLGVNETVSPALTRRSLPYRPGMFKQSTPGITLTIPWWSQLHKDGVSASSAAKWRNLERIKADNYYELCRATWGTVGTQITIAGYPSSYMDIYEAHKRNKGLNPHCVVISKNQGAGTITVDNNDLFPVVPYYGEKLEYITDAGIRLTATYANRTGTLAYATLGASTTFSGVVGLTAFWNDLLVGDVVRLSGPYDNYKAGEIFTDSLSSIVTRNLPQTLHGSRDSNSLHVPDAYMCMWHPNLGRPFTWYSDDSAGTTAATTTITITVFTELNAGDKANLVATDGTNYDFVQGAQSSVNGTFEATTSNEVTATNLMNVINTSSGPAGTRFTATVDGAVVTVTQAVGGIAGNTTVTLTDSGTAGMTKTNFIGGTGVRLFYDANGNADNPVDKKAYNTLPEHFETVHYHDFFYAASKGPFALGMQWLHPLANVVGVAATGSITILDPNELLLPAPATAQIIATDTTVITATAAGITTTSDITNPTFAVNTVDPVATAANLATCLNANSRLTASAVGPQVNITQAIGTGAQNPNTVITIVDPAAPGMAKIDFTGGVNPSTSAADGTVRTATAIDALLDGGGTLDHQGATDGSDKYNFAVFWPGGSKGGPGVSRLDGFAESLIGWGNKTYGIDCVGFRDNSGVEQRTYTQMTSDSSYSRQHCFGYRFSVRQPYNRPRWSPAVRGFLELANANALLGYYHGPLVMQDGKASGWDYVGSDGGQSDTTVSANYVGIMERLTQVSALVGQDQLGKQVRYSEGRRMTRSFGCPVRTLRNPSTVRRLYPGDNSGKEIKELANAHRYYMVDWWGNTRGEDIRRFPVRGFGIRPAWDPEDAYTGHSSANRPSISMWAGDLSDAQSGNSNTVNNSVANMAKVDWFNPAKALRVGDRGDGRGVRWPTLFNESLLQDVSEPVSPTGLLLSHSTSESSFGNGFLRPRNDNLQDSELPRGISSRLGVAASDGLLQPSSSVGSYSESISGTFSPGQEVLTDPVPRFGERIGLDSDTVSEIEDGEHTDYVATSTQGSSLHTDREVGQRTSISGAYDGASKTLTDLDLTVLNWAAQPKAGIIKVSNAHAYWPLGGSYVMEASNHLEPFDDKGWGNVSGTGSSNPYQDGTQKPLVARTNSADKAVRFLVRPTQVLDNRHVELFRLNPMINRGPQSGSNFYRATSGGKYGMFTYEALSARTGTHTPTSPPYQPVYTVDPSGSLTVPTSQGPKIPGADMATFSKTSLNQTAGRVIMSENTLEHFRSDAPRRQTNGEETQESRPDFSVEPRFSQSLHPKGEDGTSSYNTGDHSGE